jgi:hypothetical protein
MYVVKPGYEGSHITLPTELRKFGIYTTLRAGTNQKILEYFFKYGHPGIELKEKKNDNSK